MDVHVPPCSRNTVRDIIDHCGRHRNTMRIRNKGYEWIDDVALVRTTAGMDMGRVHATWS